LIGKAQGTHQSPLTSASKRTKDQLMIQKNSLSKLNNSENMPNQPDHSSEIQISGASAQEALSIIDLLCPTRMTAFESKSDILRPDSRGHLLIIDKRVEGISVAHRARFEVGEDGLQEFVADADGDVLLGTNLFVSRRVPLGVVAHFYATSRVLLARQRGLESVASRVRLGDNDASQLGLTTGAFVEQGLAGAIDAPGLNLMSTLGMTHCSTLRLASDVVHHFLRRVRTQ
jgi:hypothetical protein